MSFGWLRRNEPLRLVLWPILVAAVSVLVTDGVISTDAADLITAVALLIFGGTGIEAVRLKVTPGGHIADAVTAVIEQVREQVGTTLGQPGLDALSHVEQALAAAAEGRGRHEG